MKGYGGLWRAMEGCGRVVKGSVGPVVGRVVNLSPLTTALPATVFAFGGIWCLPSQPQASCSMEPLGYKPALPPGGGGGGGVGDCGPPSLKKHAIKCGKIAVKLR